MIRVNIQFEIVQQCSVCSYKTISYLFQMFVCFCKKKAKY